MKKGIIIGILILLLAGCNEANGQELKLAIMDDQGNKQKVETVICTDIECNEGNEKYFEVLKIKYGDNEGTIDDLSQEVVSYSNSVGTAYTDNDYINNSIDNWKYTIVQGIAWSVSGQTGETFEFDLCFRRFHEGTNGEWISKSDYEWSMLKQVTEEMSQNSNIEFTVTVEILIPEGDSQKYSTEAKED